MHSIARLIFILSSALLAACQAGARADTDVTAPSVPLQCSVDADCAVKDVGNCCGYYPACVHKDQPVDPEAVKARCEREGTMSICGFPDISACACVDKRCVPTANGGDAARE